MKKVNNLTNPGSWKEQHEKRASMAGREPEHNHHGEAEVLLSVPSQDKSQQTKHTPRALMTLNYCMVQATKFQSIFARVDREQVSILFCPLMAAWTKHCHGLLYTHTEQINMYKWYRKLFSASLAIFWFVLAKYIVRTKLVT